MSGTWTEAAAGCDCHWGNWGRAQADWMALVGPLAQTLLLSGDSRAEGNNPHGLGLSSGVREHLHHVPRAVTPHLPWQHWNCVPWRLLCPWHGLAVSVWGQWGRGAAGVWFMSEPGPVHSFVPLQGSGSGDSCMSPGCPAELPHLWAGAWAGLCSRTGMSCSSPTLGLVNSPHSTAALQGREVVSLPDSLGATRSSGAVKTPVTAEPICVFSGSLFLTPGFGDAAPCCSPSAPHPALLLPCIGASTPSSLGTPWPIPIPLPAGNSAVPAQAVGETECSASQLGREGLLLLLPLSVFIPHLSSPLAATMECPWSSHVRSQTWLLPVPQQAAPASQPSHSWKRQGILTWIRCAGVLLVELFGLIPPPGTGAGRTFLQAGILPGQETSISSPPFPHGPP